MGQSKRNWKSRWAEHKPVVRSGVKSSIKDYVECFGDNASMNNVKILQKNIDNLHKGAVFESLHSILDNGSVNKHQVFPINHLHTISRIM